jgi:hypothetical protein
MGKGHDAYAHVQREAVQILFFRMIDWCVDCHSRFIPQVDYEPHVLLAASRLLGSVPICR